MSRVFLLLFTLFVFDGASWKSTDINGLWFNQQQDAKIEIYSSYGQFYGVIRWLKNPIDTVTHKPKLDKHNPDKTLRNRPVLGLLILKHLSFDADDHDWTDGDVYDPKSGNTYSLTCRLKDINTMELHGYIGISLLGRTDTWKRVVSK